MRPRGSAGTDAQGIVVVTRVDSPKFFTNIPSVFKLKKAVMIPSIARFILPNEGVIRSAVTLLVTLFELVDYTFDCRPRRWLTRVLCS